MQLSRLMNSLAFVIKCLLSIPPSSNLLQISRHLLFVSPVNWLALNAMCPKLTDQWSLDKIEREHCLKMPMKVVILSLLINVLSAHQADCFQVMEERHHTTSFMVVHCFMMRLLVLSGLRIKSLLERVALWWPKNTLNNGYGNPLLLKFITFTETMESSMRNSLFKIARTIIFWSWCLPSKFSCWVVNSNHHVHGQDLYGSCFIALGQIWSW